MCLASKIRIHAEVSNFLLHFDSNQAAFLLPGDCIKIHPFVLFGLKMPATTVAWLKNTFLEPIRMTELDENVFWMLVLSPAV